MIRTKVRRLVECGNEGRPPSDNGQSISPLTFSDEWLDNFKRSWKFCTVLCHGDNGDAYVGTLNDQIPSLSDTLQSKGGKDHFNADLHS